MLITDYTGLLSSSSATKLQSIGYSFNPKIVILDKSPDNLGEYAKSLKPVGDDLVMVIDVPGRQVRTLGGPSLTDKGVDGPFLKAMQNQCFVPKMRKKDLEGAIKDSMDFVQSKVTVAQNVPITNQPTTVVINPAPVQTTVDFNPVMGGVMLVVGVVCISAVLFGRMALSFKINERESKFKDLMTTLSNQVVELEAKSAGPRFDAWMVRYKLLVDAYSKYRTTKQPGAERLAQITALIQKAETLISDVPVIPVKPQQGGFIDRTPVKAPPPPPQPREMLFGYEEKKQPAIKEAFKTTIPRPRSAAPFDPHITQRPKQNEPTDTLLILNTYAPLSTAETYFKSKPVEEDEKPSSSSSSSDSGSSSWSNSSSSSSDSGSSSFDSGGFSDSGSSGW